MRTTILFALLCLINSSLANQISRIQYIDQWKEVAQENMRTYRIPASIILAQGILESGSGNSDLARKANNHFGIKCHSSWTGGKFYKDDDSKDECFRSYSHAMDSYKDHAIFLTSGKRYESLFSLNGTDYESWAHGLKKAGYATHPEYAQKLIQVIEENALYKYDGREMNIRPNMKPNSPLSKPGRANEQALEIQIGLNTSQVNKVHCVIVQAGQTLYKISKESGVSLRQLYKYNDFETGKEVLQAGEIVFLQPKRFKSADRKFVTIQQGGTTLRAVSQEQGVRLKSLMRKNKIENPDDQIEAKTKIKL